MSNIPVLTVKGFSEDQNGCVQPDETVTLLANINNKNNNTNNYGYIMVFLSNTEIYTDDILIECLIEEQQNIGSTDKLICIIPYNIYEGYYSIYYKYNLTSNYNCPTIIINSFNSLNFDGKINKLRIVHNSDNYKNLKLKLINITFENPSHIPGLFNLTFSLNDIINIESITFENITQKDIGIKLVDITKVQINTRCNLIIKSEEFIFYIICTPETFKIKEKYSIVILKDIKIGYNTKQVCSNEDTSFYSNILIPQAEYDIYIIYNVDNSSYLDCNIDKTGFLLDFIILLDNFCDFCGINCLMCKSKNICSKCLEGFHIINSKECGYDRDIIDYKKFKDIENFISSEDICNDNDNYRQLFSIVVSYVITKGENLIFESEEYNDNIFAIKGNESYGLNCIIDVNPNYIPNGQYYGTCKQSLCTLKAFLNCSFNEKVPNGIYEIKINSNNNFGNLLKKTIQETSIKEIKYIASNIIANIIDDSIQIVYQGYSLNSERIYICPNSLSHILECNKLNNCIRISYDENKEETTFKCSNEKNYNEGNYQKIMIEDYCWNYINATISYKSSNSSYNDSNEIEENKENSSLRTFINLFRILIILLFFI